MQVYGDTWDGSGTDFQTSQHIPMGSNLPPTLTLTLDVRCGYTLRPNIYYHRTIDTASYDKIKMTLLQSLGDVRIDRSYPESYVKFTTRNEVRKENVFSCVCLFTGQKGVRVTTHIPFQTCSLGKSPPARPVQTCSLCSPHVSIRKRAVGLWLKDLLVLKCT